MEYTEVYVGCHYEINGAICKVIEKRNATAIVKSGNSTHEVRYSGLSGIPLTRELLQLFNCDTSVNVAGGTTTWTFNESPMMIAPLANLPLGTRLISTIQTIPFAIRTMRSATNDDEYLAYTNELMELKGEHPLPVAYLSDLEACHSGFANDPGYAAAVTSLKKSV